VQPPTTRSLTAISCLSVRPLRLIRCDIFRPQCYVQKEVRSANSQDPLRRLIIVFLAVRLFVTSHDGLATRTKTLKQQCSHICIDFTVYLLDDLVMSCVHYLKLT
jgi:hypothetical protein